MGTLLPSSILLWILLYVLVGVEGYKFSLPAYPLNYGYGNKRCLGAHIHDNTLVTGYINVTRTNPSDLPYKINAWIDDTIGNKHFQKFDLTDARFSFRTQGKPLDYQICIVNELSDGKL